MYLTKETSCQLFHIHSQDRQQSCEGIASNSQPSSSKYSSSEYGTLWNVPGTEMIHPQNQNHYQPEKYDKNTKTVIHLQIHVLRISQWTIQKSKKMNEPQINNKIISQIS